jgi:Protein of unknown function (DUF1573)
MEKSKQIQFGLLGIISLLLVANLFGGGLKNWFKSDAEKLRDAAAATVVNSASVSGNIPGTNVTTPQPASDQPPTSIQYENDVHEFGIVDEGTVVKHLFKFKNTGENPLLITNCRASCGCTVPVWPKEPVAPGATGEIRVEFNTKGKPGTQSKRVTVTANTNPTETFLEVKGEVRSKEQPVSKGTGVTQ